MRLYFCHRGQDRGGILCEGNGLAGRCDEYSDTVTALERFLDKTGSGDFGMCKIAGCGIDVVEEEGDPSIVA